MRNKTRILLFVFTLLFIGTAVTIHNSVNDTDILNLDTEKLTKNIHQKESSIDAIFGDSLILKTFENSERYPLQVREISQRYVDEEIFLYLYKGNKPIFWSSNFYVPFTEKGLKGNVNFLNTDSYSLLVKQKKISPDITLLAILPVKRGFNSNHRLLKNGFIPNLISTENLRIADFSDSENIRNIYSRDNIYLFSVKLIDGKHSSIFLQIQLVCWILATLSLILLTHSYCLELAKSGKGWISLLIISLTFIGIRVIDLETNWLARNSSFAIFDPQNYAYNYIYPNLWSFLINTISIFWLVTYFISIRKHLSFSFKSRFVRYTLYYILILFLYIIFHAIYNQLATLVTNTSLSSNNFVQVLNIDKLSFFYVVIYCLSTFSLILLTDGVLSLGRELCEKATWNLNIQLIVLIKFLIMSAIFSDYALINVLIGILIFVRSFEEVALKENKPSIHVLTLICLAIITTVKYSESIKYTQQEEMKLILTSLEYEDDIEAISLFSDLEKEIQNDQQLIQLFKISLPNTDTKVVTRYLKKEYFSGYLSNYDFKDYYYFNDIPLATYEKDKIQEYREKVISKSAKVKGTNNFYKTQTEYGSQEYFSIFTLNLSPEERVFIILNLSNKPTGKLPFITSGPDSRSHFAGQYYANDYSFALYKNGQLLTQNGNFTYPNFDSSYPKTTTEFVDLPDTNNFFHILYKPNDNTTIIVSEEYKSYWKFIAIASLSFLILYVFTMISKLFLTFVPRYLFQQFNLHAIKYHLRLIFTNVRYSTRIQTLVILSVIIAIIISGLITYISINYQTQRETQANRLSYIADIVNKIEQGLQNSSNMDPVPSIVRSISNMASISSIDFNLYNKSGKLSYSTQSKLYDQKLLSDFIHPDAYIDLNVLKKTETSNTEHIADFSFDATYASIRNQDYQTIAYLSIPYYNSAEQETNAQNILLNTILNIYTIVIIAFAFLSVFISNKITEPLQLIRRKLSQTNLGEKVNEPLYWERNDEIGVLIKEYNYMLIKLEENAKQLRNAEREIAWREMAQQVAHEIKNPLTPMKLGIQQLSRSFYENDPKLAERFAKVSNSFIEQIDTLAHIASEFSAFAKLPETKLTEINLVEKITKSIDVYNNHNNTVITLTNKTQMGKVIILGDRAQLLRTFNNLIKNAIEAGNNRRKHKIDITILPSDENWILVTVVDNGYGISEEIIPNIFRPNFTTKSSGTGLGLAFVKQTIDAMGGRIRFETQLNVGTTFFIDLPLFRG